MQEARIAHIINEVKAGNFRNFEEIIDAHKSMIFHLCFKMVSTAEDAEEIAQETFIKAFKSLPNFKGKSKFSTWLYQICYFTCISYLRKNKNQLSVERNVPEGVAEEPKESEVEKKEREQLIQQALNLLNPVDRAILSLYYLDEMDLNEVANITKLSKSNVKVRLHRARTKLKAAFEQFNVYEAF